MMRLVLLFFIVSVVVSCSSTQLPKMTTAAQQAFIEGDYTKSLDLWEQVILIEEQNTPSVPSKSYEYAADAAYELGNMDKAEQYYKLAFYHQTAGPHSYKRMAELYRKQGNLSREGMVLEPLIKLFPESKEAKSERPNLFSLFVDAAQWQMAYDLWPPAPDSDSNQQLLENYLMVLQKLDKEQDAEKIATKLLSLNPQHLPALEWRALNFYNKGEARYQQELEAYEKKKTSKQYNTMLKGLDAATDDFKKSLNILLKLYKREPSARYALYLSNIYARFNDEKNANYYRAKSQ